jgi:hypothetical protein
VFEPKDGCLECPYCHRKEQIPASAEEIRENSYQEYLAERPDQMKVLAENAQEIQCSSCGALVTFTPPEVTGECSFCGARFVNQPKSADPAIAPKALLPFAWTQAQALERVKAWLASRWFAPNALKQVARPEKLQGIYLPFWTYDSYTVSHYTGKRGEYYYVTETSTETDSQGKQVTRTRQVRHTRWYPAAGTVSRWFDDVLIAASRALPRPRLAALEPWDLQQLKPYDSAFLAGYSGGGISGSARGDGRANPGGCPAGHWGRRAGSGPRGYSLFGHHFQAPAPARLADRVPVQPEGVPSDDQCAHR